MRRARTHYSNAMYHVMLRGNYQQPIFHTDSDRLAFYALLEESTKQYNCKVHLFCLMTNHVHLVVEVEHIPLHKFVHKIAANYARALNKSTKRSGHLFQGRYRAKLIQNDKYFLELCYYIHNNPLKAKMVETLDAYQWSSHRCYAEIDSLNWLTTKHMTKLLDRQVVGEDKYRLFMEDRVMRQHFSAAIS